MPDRLWEGLTGQRRYPKRKPKHLTAVFLTENLKMFGGKSQTGISMKSCPLALTEKLDVSVVKLASIIPIHKFQSFF